MPTYEVTFATATLTATSVQPGPDNAGQRRAAVNDACTQLGIAREFGLYAVLVPDGDDNAATVIEFGPGQQNGTWVERPSPRERPQQAQQAQAAVAARRL